MILDNLLAFSPIPGDNLAQVVGTYASANVIDLGISSGIPTSASGGGARDIGIGDDPALKLLVLVSTAFTGTTGTLQVTLQGAIDNGAGVPAAFVSWWASPLYTIAQLVVGARLYDMDMPRPPDGVAIPRFIRLLYGIATATMTAGNVEAFLVLDRHDQFYTGTVNSTLSGYPAGVTVAN